MQKHNFVKKVCAVFTNIIIQDLVNRAICSEGKKKIKCDLFPVKMQTHECPKIQKAVGNPITHIDRLTSCPKLSKIKQNITEKHTISLKNEEK